MLSTTSKYALKALAHLGAQPPGVAMVTSELAKHASIPHNYLYKILSNLKNAGILYASRGIGGGYTLRKKPDKITLLDVVNIFEGGGAEPSCLLEEHRICSDHKPCAAHHKWKEVRRAYIDFLKTTTIASISENLSSEVRNIR